MEEPLEDSEEYVAICFVISYFQLTFAKKRICSKNFGFVSFSMDNYALKILQISLKNYKLHLEIAFVKAVIYLKFNLHYEV